MKPIVIIAIAVVLLISSITPNANAEPLQIIQECSNNSHIIKISNSEGPVKNVSLHIYTSIGMMEYEGKVVSNENGEAKIDKSSRNNVAKITKGGYNDTTIFLTCPSPKSESAPEPIIVKSPKTPTPVVFDGIPDWVKNTAGWWSDGQLKDEEFVNSVGFLIKNGIITLPKTETDEGVSLDMIFNLIPNKNLELVFDGGVVPVPVSPVFLELTDPNGILTEKNQMIGAGGHYSFPLQFPDHSILGVYDVKLFFNHKLIKSESFKLEKPIPTHTIIPDWVKNNAKWWAHDEIDEGSFISGIQYLVNSKIIILETNDIGKSFKNNSPSSEYTKTHIDGFPNPVKSSKYYLDRYNNDFKYREWFNSQFPHKTMYDVLGIHMDDEMVLELIAPDYLSIKNLEVKKTENILLKNDEQFSISTKYTDLQSNDSLELRIVKTNSEYCALQGFQGFSMSAGYFGACGFMLNVDSNGELDRPLNYFPYYYLFSDEAFCVGFEDYFIQCSYNQFFFSVQLDKESIKINDHSKILSIFLIEKIFDNIDTVNHNSFISKNNFDSSNWREKSFTDVIQEYGIQMIRNEDVVVEGAITQIEDEGFSGLYCQQDGNWVEMTGRFTNGPDSYSSIYFTLGILDNSDRIVATGIGSVSNIGPYQTKMFDASAQWSGNFKECLIEIDFVVP
jgi:hypothetical protein